MKHFDRVTAGLSPVLVLAGFLSLGPRSIAEDVLNLSVSVAAEGGIRLSWPALEGPSLYTVQFKESISDAAWSALPPASQWPIKDTSFVDRRLPATGHRFYRVLAEPEPPLERGRLISSQRVDMFTEQEVESIRSITNFDGLTVESGVALFKLVYETIDPEGNRTSASGAVFVPTDTNESLAMVSFHHGTEVRGDFVPSSFALNDLDSLAPFILASTRYFVVAPDYLGLGDSRGFHPYMQAKPSATAVVDMLRAARQMAGQTSIPLTNQLFLVGYAQGGYVTLAAQREIEEFHRDEFKITASIPMASPANLSQTMIDILLSNRPFARPFFIPYLILAYNQRYPFFKRPEEVFIPSIAVNVLPLYQSRRSAFDINLRLPSVPRQMFQPAFLDALASDKNHPLRVALRENDLLDWAPEGEIRMYHCDGDQVFPKSNSEIALQRFLDQGAPLVDVIDVLPAAGHDGCAFPSFLSAKFFMDSLRD